MVRINKQLVDALITFLDEQTLQVERTLEDLDQLRAAVIRRDQNALENLQAHIRHANSQKENAQKEQQQLQTRLSGLLACSPSDVTVSRLCEYLDSQDRQAVQVRQRRLQSLVRTLKNEHQATELMLRECARFNRLLLSCLIGEKNQTRTYSDQGKEQWSVHQGLMNIKM
jgi:hypothetical protein